MSRETTIVESDYWYRLIDNGIPNFVYSWGPDLETIFRANLHYRGRGTYTLSGRTVNGKPMPYVRGRRTAPEITINRRVGKRTPGYITTLRLILRLLE